MILQGVLGILILSLTYALYLTTSVSPQFTSDYRRQPHKASVETVTLANASLSCEATANEFPCVTTGVSPSEDEVGEGRCLLVQDADLRKVQGFSKPDGTPFSVPLRRSPDQRTRRIEAFLTKILATTEAVADTPLFFLGQIAFPQTLSRIGGLCPVSFRMTHSRVS